MAERIGVIGAGAWGTTLARMLAAADHPVTLWAHRPEAAEEMTRDGRNRRYLPDYPFPPGLLVTGDAAELTIPHRLYVLAVPSAHARETLRRVAGELAPGTPFLSVVKGIEAGTQARMSEVIGEEAPRRAVAVLSGPNLAAEVASGLPAGTVVASGDPALAAEVAALLGSDQFRVYTNPDVVGVELGGALKNVIALAGGMADGLRMGDSGKAAIITRGLAEMTRLAVALGARRETLAGLAGMGDLVLTCTGGLSRNRTVGVELGKGRPLDHIVGSMRMVAEGVSTTAAAVQLARKVGVEMPIAEQMHAVLYQGRPPRDAIRELMERRLKNE